jgi:transposase
VLPAVDRLDEITRYRTGGRPGDHRRDRLHMNTFPTAARLVSWPKLSLALSSHPARLAGQPGPQGNAGEAAATAAGTTDTFLGKPCRHVARHRGKVKAIVAISRSILVIVWHLLTDRSVRYHDLGASC